MPRVFRTFTYYLKNKKYLFGRTILVRNPFPSLKHLSKQKNKPVKVFKNLFLICFLIDRWFEAKCD